MPAEPKLIPLLVLGQESKRMHCVLASKMEHFIFVPIILKSAIITDCKGEGGQVYWGIWGSSAFHLTPAGTA